MGWIFDTAARILLNVSDTGGPGEIREIVRGVDQAVRGAGKRLVRRNEIARAVDEIAREGAAHIVLLSRDPSNVHDLLNADVIAGNFLRAHENNTFDIVRIGGRREDSSLLRLQENVSLCSIWHEAARPARSVGYYGAFDAKDAGRAVVQALWKRMQEEDAACMAEITRRYGASPKP